MVNHWFPFEEVNGSLQVLHVEVKASCVSEKAQIFGDSGRLAA